MLKKLISKIDQQHLGQRHPVIFQPNAFLIFIFLFLFFSNRFFPLSNGHVVVMYFGELVEIKDPTS